jgi:hypothetical protein
LGGSGNVGRVFGGVDGVGLRGVSDRSYSVGGCLGGLGLETQKRMITNIIGLRRSLYCVEGCGVQTEVFQKLDIRDRYLLIY